MVKDFTLFSDCGLFFAYCGQDGKLRLWDTATGLLKQEYVPNLHLNSPFTSIVWINVSSSFVSPWKSKKRKVEDDTKVLAVGTADGSVALYSLSEGKIACKLEGGHSTPVTGLAWSKEEGLFSSCTKEVISWDVSNKVIKSKWNCGKGKITCLAVSEDGEFCVTGSTVLKLWNVKNKELLQTYMGHSSEVLNITFVNSQYFLSCGSEDRHISIWTTKSEHGEPLGRFALGEAVRSSVSIFENKGTVHLGASTNNGMLLYFHHQLNGKVGKLIKPQHTIEVLEGNSGNSLPVVGVKMTSEASAMMVYGHPNFFSFEALTFNDFKKHRVSLTRSSTKHQKLTPNNKVVNDTNDQAEYASSGVRRKIGGDVAMEERLGNLSIGNPVISDKHSPYNLSNLLTQGLESKDRSILESVLFKKDPQVITETVSKLPISALGPLISQLNTMIQGKTLSSMTGCLWLKGVLRQHSGQLLASGDCCSVLASVQALVESRLAVLGPLRGLSGRLDHIVSQLDTPQGQQATDQQCVLVYQEEDSSDERESLMLDGEGSESEDKWEELSDEQLDTDDALNTD